MAKINPKFVYDEQEKKIGVVLDIKEFEKCIDVLEDYQDYQLIRTRSGKKEKLIPLKEVIEKTLTRMKK
jgi:ribosomal 30S subunit maturation factor RimM